ncbi:MAG: DUF1963 domain-containing protein [Saprospiraceae bacterium]
MTFQPKLPFELELYRSKLEATARPFIKIIPTETGITSVLQSKTGGTPFLPKSARYPMNSKGEPLFFLAQLNFGEMPRLENFPEKGILQFYINNESGLGMDYQDPFNQADFRVLYFENTVEEDAASGDELPMPTPVEELPIAAGLSYPLAFERKEEIVPLSDYQFEKLLGEDFFEPFGERQWDIMDTYSKLNNASGHKTGGYAFFTQQDPRYRMGGLELLFQLDTDKAIHCMWGDMGVGHFFIQKEDLLSLDFSKTMFHWDCY